MTETNFTITYGPLLTTTLMKVLDSGALTDNVFNQDVTLQWLRNSGRVKVVDGGERLRLGILDAKNTTAQWYADYEALNSTAMAGMTSAFYAWKQGSVSISINGRELRSNSGPAKIADLQKEKITQAALSLTDLVATGVFSDGTGTGSKQLTGLTAMCETTPLTVIYASVPLANTAWANQAQASVGAGAVNLLPKLRTLMNDCKQGKGGMNGQPDFIVTTQSIHETFEALVFPQVRYEPNPKGGADAGIQVLKFKGAEVEWDDYCTSGCVYCLNSKFIWLVVHRAANFTMADGGFQKPINQDALVTQILFQGNLVTNARKKHGKLQGVT